MAAAEVLERPLLETALAEILYMAAEAVGVGQIPGRLRPAGPPCSAELAGLGQKMELRQQQEHSPPEAAEDRKPRTLARVEMDGRL